MRKKLCIVTSHYGTNVCGEIECYCRAFAEKLCKLFEIEVVTTCAVSPQCWENHYTEGICEINGVKVRRFTVDFPKDSKKFLELTSRIFNNSTHTIEEAKSWIEAQGPVSLKMVDYIKESKDSFDAFIFMTYSYYHTGVAMPFVREKAVLMPFACKEPTIFLRAFDEVFSAPKGIIYNTENEMVLVQNLFKNKEIPSIIAGIGLNVPTRNEFLGRDKKFRINSPYIIYFGEISEQKCCDRLIQFFRQYKRIFRNDLKLVLAGKEQMKFPKDRNIISIGCVGEEEKYALIEKSVCLVLPSFSDGFPVSMLEAFMLKKPVLASAHCEAYKEHCLKSDAGLFFYGEIDFLDCLDLLYNNKELCEALGKNGEKYTDDCYQWNSVLSKLTKFLNELT